MAVYTRFGDPVRVVEAAKRPAGVPPTPTWFARVRRLDGAADPLDGTFIHAVSRLKADGGVQEIVEACEAAAGHEGRA